MQWSPHKNSKWKGLEHFHIGECIHMPGGWGIPNSLGTLLCVPLYLAIHLYSLKYPLYPRNIEYYILEYHFLLDSTFFFGVGVWEQQWRRKSKHLLT